MSHLLMYLDDELLTLGLTRDTDNTINLNIATVDVLGFTELQ